MIAQIIPNNEYSIEHRTEENNGVMGLRRGYEGVDEERGVDEEYIPNRIYSRKE